jgi:hypothetical protein
MIKLSLKKNIVACTVVKTQPNYNAVIVQLCCFTPVTIVLQNSQIVTFLAFGVVKQFPKERGFVRVRMKCLSFGNCPFLRDCSAKTIRTNISVVKMRVTEASNHQIEGVYHASQ